MIRKLIGLASFLALALSCTAGHVAPPPFDGDRAMTYLSKQVEFGPRVPGTAPWRRCQEYLGQFFTGLGGAVHAQSFTFRDPYSNTDTPLVNITARFKGVDQNLPPLLFVAHWDSRPRTDFPSVADKANDPIAGANDGASGVAVLMELANGFAAKPPACDIVLLLVDGEDWGKEGDVGLYLLGSKQFASSEIRGRYRFGIVLDMIGDRDQQIYREAYSDRFYRSLNDMVWHTAHNLGISTFVDSVKFTVIDDHLSFSAAGVPTIDLIDFDYPYWHTDQDTPDKCSAASLANVGRILAEIAYNKSLWPKN